MVSRARYILRPVSLQTHDGALLGFRYTVFKLKTALSLLQAHHHTVILHVVNIAKLDAMGVCPGECALHHCSICSGDTHCQHVALGLRLDW